MATFIWPPEVQWPPPAHILMNYDVVAPDGVLLSSRRDRRGDIEEETVTQPYLALITPLAATLVIPTSLPASAPGYGGSSGAHPGNRPPGSWISRSSLVLGAAASIGGRPTRGLPGEASTLAIGRPARGVVRSIQVGAAADIRIQAAARCQAANAPTTPFRLASRRPVERQCRRMSTSPRRSPEEIASQYVVSVYDPKTMSWTTKSYPPR